jgi:hypothetical protein
MSSAVMLCRLPSCMADELYTDLALWVFSMFVPDIFSVIKHKLNFFYLQEVRRFYSMLITLEWFWNHCNGFCMVSYSAVEMHIIAYSKY